MSRTRNETKAQLVAGRLYKYLRDHYNEQEVVVPTFIHNEIYREILDELKIKDEEWATILEKKKFVPLTVGATVHSDDFVFEVNFDATLWFEQASDKEIKELSAEAWHGCYVADDVARYMAYSNNDVDTVLDYVAGKKNMGFEVIVNETEAMDWIKRYRPSLIEALVEA